MIKINTHLSILISYNIRIDLRVFNQWCMNNVDISYIIFTVLKLVIHFGDPIFYYIVGLKNHKK